MEKLFLREAPIFSGACRYPDLPQRRCRPQTVRADMENRRPSCQNRLRAFPRTGTACLPYGAGRARIIVTDDDMAYNALLAVKRPHAT